MAISEIVAEIVSIIWSKVTPLCKWTKGKKYRWEELYILLYVKNYGEGEIKFGGLMKSSVPWIILKGTSIPQYTIKGTETTFLIVSKVRMLNI